MMEIQIEKSERAKKAMNYFLSGYNCSQAIVLAFEDLYDIDRSTMLALSSSFGGGMGRLREVCGSVSGMFIVAGILYGYEKPKDAELKAEHYARIQELAREFRERNGSIVCRELLGLDIKGADHPTPETRTTEYYKKRPCKEIVGLSAAILENYINHNPYQKR